MPVRVMSDKSLTLRAIPDSYILSFAINSSSVDTPIFVANEPMEVIAVQEVHETAGTDAGSVVLDVKKVTGTTTGTSGTSILSSTFNLKSTAKTVVTKDGSSGLTATLADRKLDSGDRLFADFTGTLTALAGGIVTVHLKRLLTAGAGI